MNHRVVPVTQTPHHWQASDAEASWVNAAKPAIPLRISVTANHFAPLVRATMASGQINPNPSARTPVPGPIMRRLPHGSGPSARPGPLCCQNADNDYIASATQLRSGWRFAGTALRQRIPACHGTIQWIKKGPSVRRPKPFLLQVMPPRINLLPPNLMTLRYLRHARPADTNRHDNLELVVVIPEASPLHPKNLAPHRTPHIRHVANDVIKHVS
jgi:hypothetical protein